MGLQWTIITLHILTSSIQDISENYGLRLLAQFYAWCSKVFQRSRTNKRLDIGKIQIDLLWEILSFDYGDWEVHGLLSASGRPWKAGGVVSYQVWRPENHGSRWCESQSKGRKKWMFQLNRLREWFLPSSLFLYHPGLQRMWVMPTHTREGHMFLSVYWFKCWSHPETRSQTHLEIMFN